MDIDTYISVSSEICHGQPCFKGTRIMVYLILEMLEAGETVEQILKSYPSLTLDSVRAALHYAAEVIKSERFFPFSSTA